MVVHPLVPVHGRLGDLPKFKASLVIASFKLSRAIYNKNLSKQENRASISDLTIRSGSLRGLGHSYPHITRFPGELTAQPRVIYQGPSTLKQVSTVIHLGCCPGVARSRGFPSLVSPQLPKPLIFYTTHTIIHRAVSSSLKLGRIPTQGNDQIRLQSQPETEMLRRGESNMGHPETMWQGCKTHRLPPLPWTSAAMLHLKVLAHHHAALAASPVTKPESSEMGSKPVPRSLI